MRQILFGLLLITVPRLQAASGDIEKMFRSLLAQGEPVPTEIEFQAKVVGEVETLSPSDVKNLLPLAQKAVHSSRPKVREYGMKFFLAVSLRPTMDSAEILSSCEPDLEAIVTAKGDPLRRFALTVIVFLRPRIPPELVKFL